NSGQKIDNRGRASSGQTACRVGRGRKRAILRQAGRVLALKLGEQFAQPLPVLALLDRDGLRDGVPSLGYCRGVPTTTKSITPLAGRAAPPARPSWQTELRATSRTIVEVRAQCRSGRYPRVSAIWGDSENIYSRRALPSLTQT